MPDELVAGSEIFILGQNPGASEERDGRPFTGQTGHTMEREYFPLAGIERGKVSIGNVLRCRANHSDALPTGDSLDRAIHHCNRYLDIPDSTALLIAQGHLAWRVASGEPNNKITDWRGFLAPNLTSPYSVYGVLHLSARNKDHQQMFAARRDWSKVRQIMSGQWPATIPSRIVLTDDSQWSEVETWFEMVRKTKTPLYCDTEYLPDGKMTVLGLGAAVPTDQRGSTAPTPASWAVSGLQIMWLTAPVSPWVRAKLCQELQRTVHEVPVVFHNAMADIPILEENMGVRADTYIHVDDTMLAHSVLWSELPHDLEFLASIYGQYPKLKHLARTNTLLYNWGDVLATIDVWHALEQELARDKGSHTVYTTQLLPLIPVILEAQERGLAVNTRRVQAAKAEYERILSETGSRANVFYGAPFNLASEKQLKHYFYTERAYPIQRDHKTKKPSSADSAVNALRQIVGPAFDPEYEESHGGLTLEAALGRIDLGGDPLLEFRTVHAGALQALSHYISPCDTDEGRVYPRFATHTQANGRWSTTDPPLAQLPDGLRDIICPDDGEAWVSWDWKNIEPRLKQAYSGSTYLKRIFDNDWDLHTINFCYAFNYPQPPNLKDPSKAPENANWRALVRWQGKEDVRRVFCKRLQYKMDYGGSPETAIQIPGAKQLGLDPAKLRAVGYAILQADPQALAWRQGIIREAQRSRRVTTFSGRVRRLLGSDLRAIGREAINFPMQAGVSDIFNSTTVEVKRRCPWVRFAWQMHDSVYWACPVERLDDIVPQLRSIAERPFSINGCTVSFPADFKPIIYAPKGEVRI